MGEGVVCVDWEEEEKVVSAGVKGDCEKRGRRSGVGNTIKRKKEKRKRQMNELVGSQSLCCSVLKRRESTEEEEENM